MLLFRAGLICACWSIGASLIPADATPQPVAPTPHFADPYAWMETQPARTAAWLQQQTQRSRKLIAVLPQRTALSAELSAANPIEANDTGYDTPAGRFYLQMSADYPYWRLFLQPEQAPARVVIAPPVGFGISFFSPSDDGTYLAYGLSENGAETTSLQLLDVASGRPLPDVMPQVRYPTIIWNPDNRSFFYTSEAFANTDATSTKINNQGIYLHRIGQAQRQDATVLDIRHLPGLDNNRQQISSVTLYTAPNSNWFIAMLSPAISGYGSYIYAAPVDAVRNNQAKWQKINDINDKVAEFVFSGHWLYIAQYNTSAGYNISRIDLDRPQDVKPLLSWSQGDLVAMNLSRDALYVAYHSAGVRQFVRLPLQALDKPQTVPRAYDGEVSALNADITRSEISYTLQSWTQPPSVHHFTPEAPARTHSRPEPADTQAFANYQVDELWVTSDDQVRVPLTLVRPQGAKRDGSAATWLTAYGAYGVSSWPQYDAAQRVWLEHGGTLAFAHVRGGGELGPAWHDAARGTGKIHSVSDFIHCADYLVQQRYTRPSRLVISGQSAGGIVIGMALTQRPQLFAAAAINVGMLNMSRLAAIPIGQSNYAEFGSADTAQGQQDLLRIDAYRHLRPGVHYPALLLTLGMNDERVSPWQSAKFAARMLSLQRAGDKPLLVLAQNDAGHTTGSRRQYQEQAVDLLSFFLWHTGLTAPRPEASQPLRAVQTTP